eukprot:s3056_g7.t1
MTLRRVSGRWSRFFGEAQRLEEHWRLWSRSEAAVASKASLEALSTEMKQLAEETRPSEEQEAAKDALFRQVEQAGKESLDGCTAELFGSAGTKQWMPGSDLDICLLAPDVTTSASQVRSLRKVARALRQTGASHNIQPRFHAQMPILRWTPRRPDRPGSIACDISVGNVLAVANTRLIASYLDLDDRVPLLLRAIKVGRSGAVRFVGALTCQYRGHFSIAAISHSKTRCPRDLMDAYLSLFFENLDASGLAEKKVMIIWEGTAGDQNLLPYKFGATNKYEKRDKGAGRQYLAAASCMQKQGMSISLVGPPDAHVFAKHFELAYVCGFGGEAMGSLWIFQAIQAIHGNP